MEMLAEAGASAFAGCFKKSTTSIYRFPNLAIVGDSTFNGSFKDGDTVQLPALKTMPYGVLLANKASIIDIGSHVETAHYGAIQLYNKAANVIIRTVTPPPGTFSGTRKVVDFTTGWTGHIYVPDDSVEAYKTAEGWSNNADNFLPLSAYPG